MILLPSISNASVSNFSAYAVFQRLLVDPKLNAKSTFGVMPDVTSLLKLILSVSASPKLTNDPAIVVLPDVSKFPVIFVFAFILTVFNAESIFKFPTRLSNLLSLNLIKSVLILVSSMFTVDPAVTILRLSTFVKSIVADSISVFPVS